MRGQTEEGGGAIPLQSRPQIKCHSNWGGKCPHAPVHGATTIIIHALLSNVKRSRCVHNTRMIIFSRKLLCLPTEAKPGRRPAKMNGTGGEQDALLSQCGPVKHPSVAQEETTWRRLYVSECFRSWYKELSCLPVFTKPQARVRKEKCIRKDFKDRIKRAKRMPASPNLIDIKRHYCRSPNITAVNKNDNWNRNI